LQLIATLTKEPEMLQPDAFYEHTMQQNATAYSASPDPLVLRGRFAAGRGTGNGGEGQGGREREGGRG